MEIECGKRWRKCSRLRGNSLERGKKDSVICISAFLPLSAHFVLPSLCTLIYTLLLPYPAFCPSDSLKLDFFFFILQSEKLIKFSCYFISRSYNFLIANSDCFSFETYLYLSRRSIYHLCASIFSPQIRKKKVLRSHFIFIYA